jgi:V/A-type H+-transporting ATPase subunit I
MIRPEKMKFLEITVLQRDIDEVLKFLGRDGILQFFYTDKPTRKKSSEERDETHQIAESLEKIRNVAAYLEVELEDEPGETSEKATIADKKALEAVFDPVSTLQKREYDARLERERLVDRLKNLSGLENFDLSPGDINNLSFLNLKIGRLDSEKLQTLQQNMGERAVVMKLGAEEVLIASSRRDRFMLESELRDGNWLPLNIDEGGSESGSGSEAPADGSTGAVRELQARLGELEGELDAFTAEKKHFTAIYRALLQNLYASWLLSEIIDNIKGRLVSTQCAFMLSGWIPLRALRPFIASLANLTGGRTACRSFDPWEVEEVRDGKEQIPVSLRHGAFARAFQPLVLSYGAPAYGSIDPTPIVAVFFALLFGIMFGDVGQGLCLFLAGLLASNKKIKFFENYRHFAGPLKIIGIMAMFTGILYGSVFSNEALLAEPTRIVTHALSQTDFGRFFHITGREKIIELMPERGGDVAKLFYFFGFTLAVGFILNSTGLVLNIINHFSMRRYKEAFLSKNGIAGVIFFWYAVSIAVRAIVQGGGFNFMRFDAIVLLLSVLAIAAGPFIWAIFSKDKKPLEEGLFTCVMEGIVEVLETVSSYFSNSVSFLRVGAFALSHAILSFIVFSMANMIATVPLGTLWSIAIIIFGNTLIIVLEGMIVAIQVIRLEYYEFFGKFWGQSGNKWMPFQFRKK